jgi:hypothetical protein
MKKSIALISLLALAGCNGADQKMAELQALNLSCATISQMHAKNELTVDLNKADADERGKGKNAAIIIGALFFTPLASMAQAEKQSELDRYQVPMKENHSLRKLAEIKKCPVPKTKYPDPNDVKPA